jgi:spore germination protein GerM
MSIRRKTVVTATVLLLVAACGGSSTPSAQPTSAPSTAVASPSASPTPSPTTVVRATHVYFLHGEQVVSVHRDVAVTSGAIATAAVRALLAGPSALERAAGLTSAIPMGTQLRGITVASGTADVDLSATYESGGGSLSMSARLMQVVFTLTQFPTVQRVTWRLDGKPVKVFGGEGLIIDRPATRAQYTSFLPPIWIDSPAWGETVGSPVTVKGLANVFEGQFLLEVTDAAGKVLVREPATASMGTHTAFEKTLSFTVAQPGAGRVTGFDHSAKDGARVDETAVPVTLR